MSASVSKSLGLGDRAALSAEPEDLGPVHVQGEHDLAEIHHDVERVFHHTRQMRELVQDVFDLDPGRRGAVDRRKKRPAIGDTDGQGEAGLERLDRQLAVNLVLDGPIVTGGQLQLKHGTPEASQCDPG